MSVQDLHCSLFAKLTHAKRSTKKFAFKKALGNLILANRYTIAFALLARGQLENQTI
jgi:hypothetical protein